MLYYLGSFSYTPHAVLCGEFPYTFHTMLCGEFLLHAPCSFIWGVSLTRPVLFYVGSFSYTPHAVLCGEFLLHAPCYYYVRIFLYTSLSFLARKSTDYCKNKVSRVKSAYRASDQPSVVITWLLCLGSGRILSLQFSGHRLLRRHFTVAGTAGLESPRYKQPADRGSEPT